MTPQKRGVILDSERARILEAMSAARAADAELKAAVVSGLLVGGSIRETADLIGMPTSTIQKWGRDGGCPSEEKKVTHTATWEANDEYRIRLEAATGAVKYVGLGDELQRDSLRQCSAYELP